MIEINERENQKSLKCLIIVYSYHHHNTEKVAQVISEVLHADLKTPDQISVDQLQAYDLIGFGAGIDSGKHYQPLLDFADSLQVSNNKNCFIFSTSAVLGEVKVKKDHALLRQKLTSKGYRVIDEFSCKGFNTNSVLKYIGGMNKGRPNVADLELAKDFANKLMWK